MSNPVDVQWYTSGMTGAYVYTGQQGGICALLKSCLIDGFNSKTLTSLVVTNNVATATVSGGHSFSDHVVILIQGATPDALNGLKRLTYINTTTFTFDAANVSNVTATGTITAKVAPANGWERPYYDDANYVAVFRQTSIETEQYFHRFNHATKAYCRLISYSTMSDVNTGNNPLQLTSGGSYITSMDDSSANTWALVVSKFGCYLFSNRIYAGYVGTAYFGETIPIHPADIRKTIHCALPSTLTTGTNGLATVNSGGNIICGMVNGVYSTMSFTKHFLRMGGTNLGGGVIPDNSGLFGTEKIVGKVYVLDSANEPRGYIPGLLTPFSTYSPSELTIENLPSSRKAIQLRCRVSDSISGYFLVDITGPWNGD